jgi:hypothetical protein
MSEVISGPLIIRGGIDGRFRELARDGLQGGFEGALYESVYADLMEDREHATAIWSALTNVEWVFRDGQSLAYSFRAAGDVVACMLREGDYLEWYCCAEAGIVSREIAGGMSCYGWSWRPYGPYPEKVTERLEERG